MTKPTAVLVILDGWGYREAEDHNAIYHANTPTWDRLWQRSPHSLLACSGQAVGLPKGQMGNSEVGHMTIGAGRVVHQDLTRIDRSIDLGEFENLPVIQRLLDAQRPGKLHILGLLSPGGVHSHQNHIHAILDLVARRGRTTVLHAFLDGRDTPPKSAISYVDETEHLIQKFPNVSLGSIHGRYFAMDRDQRWSRTLESYRLLTQGEAQFHVNSAKVAVEQAYTRDESDEFVTPTLVGQQALIEDGDDVFFMNFRADRARQLTKLFIQECDESITSNLQQPKLNSFVCLTRYEDKIDDPSPLANQIEVVFDVEHLSDTWAQVVAEAGKTQLRIAETEKYAHVTYFFSGGREQPWQGESRQLVPSPKVKTYDLLPEMSADQVSKLVTQAIENSSFDAIICNFANPDMVGHTGNFEAAIKAVECIDTCLAQITEAVENTNSDLLITADHGNVELMEDEGLGQPHTAHTTGEVPLIYVGKQRVKLAARGGLQDVAPTLLELMEIDKPQSMSGQSLFN